MGGRLFRRADNQAHHLAVILAVVPAAEATTPVLREVARRLCACVSGGDGWGMNGAIRSDAVRVA